MQSVLCFSWRMYASLYAAWQLLFQQVMTVTLRERRRLTTAPRSMLALCRRRRGSNLIYSRWRKKTSKCRHLFNKKLKMSLPVSTCVAQFNSMQTTTRLCLAQMREKGGGGNCMEREAGGIVGKEIRWGGWGKCVSHGMDYSEPKNKRYRKNGKSSSAKKKLNQTK